MKKLFKSKTFWTGIAGMSTAAGAYFEGSIGLTGLISAIFGGLGLIFMRMGVDKSGPNPTNLPPSQRGEELK